ncbi:MAG: hypothetical protein ACI9KE_004412 [Polyangiales bacterium]|jgi:hypothetical protein
MSELRTLLAACLLLATSSGCQTRQAALDALCDAPATCGTPCQTGDAQARLAAMRQHLDATIEDDSVRQIYQEYWASVDRATLDVTARAAMTEERGTPACSYFNWYRELPQPLPQPQAD